MLGSFGFSFGRACMACLVGCAVIATVPVGEGDASRKPAPVSERAPQADAAAAQLTRERPAPAKPEPSHEKKVKKHRAGSAAVGASANEATTSVGGNDGSAGGSTFPLPVELPTVELPTAELPPVEVPTVQVPQVTVPDVPLPPVPDPSDVDMPDLGSLTS